MKFITLDPLFLLYVDDAAALLKATTTSAKEKGVLSEPEDAAFVNNTTTNEKGQAHVVGPDEQFTPCQRLTLC